MNIPEKFIHYVWEKELLGNLFTLESGKTCTIINPGIGGNRDGPDFENTKILLDGNILVGNTEIHIKSSDWYHHLHHKDEIYSRTLLHIVLINNTKIYNNFDKIIPTIVISYEDIKKLYSAYSEKFNQKEKLFCLQYIDNNTHKNSKIISSLSIQRTNRKVDDVMQLFSKTNDWNETTWRQICIALGMPYNKMPMEWLANTISWKQISRIEDVKSIEAILLGQSGFLNKNEIQNNKDSAKIYTEYLHYKQKLLLSPIDIIAWKNSPLRPSSNPRLRLIYLSSIIINSPNLFSKIISAQNKFDIENIFTQNKKTNIGAATINTIIINSVIPIRMAFSKYTLNKALFKESFKILHTIKPEKNKIIGIFAKNSAIAAQNAFQSQGLIELYNNYCNKNACMSCPNIETIIYKK